MTVPALQINNVDVLYDKGSERFLALNDVSLSVNTGELVTIVGPSGAGKSTLLNLAGLLLSPTSGAVFIDGNDVTGLSRKRAAEMRRKHVGFVFQHYNLLPTLTICENVSLPLDLDGERPDTARTLAEQALREVGLEEMSNRFPDALSGGEAQRVAIARALVGRRQVLLADEPTAALDSDAADDVMKVLRSRIDSGAAGLLVTHEPRLAAYADRMVVLRDGTLREA